MSLSPKTRNVFIVALLLALGAAGGAVYLFFQIQKQGKLLESHITVITESNHKAEDFNRTERTVAETETDRRLLAGAFFKQQSDSLNFLTFIEEDLGPRSGVAVDTIDLAPVVDPKNPQTSELKITFRYTGSKAKVVDFSRLLETLPYHSRLAALLVRRAEDGSWVGEATVLITINNL